MKFKDSQVYYRKYLISFFKIKFFDLNVNQDGIKEE